MLLNSVILILQETLEAALLIGVLLAINTQLRCNHRWLWYGLSMGTVIAFIFASNMGSISESFDYAGQELLNASIQSTICILIAMAVWRIAGLKQFELTDWQGYSQRLAQLCSVIIMLAVIREGQEVMLYLSGFLGSSQHIQTVFIGSGIGFGIGASIGILLFYTLLGLPTNWKQPTVLVLLALFAGTMLSQSAVQLAQVDWIKQTAPLWNSSGLLAEESLLGELLYALIGYEAQPTAAQAIAYATGIGLVCLAALGGTRYKKHHLGNQPNGVAK